MGIAFELLREAGVRMPKPVGQAVSIVGALVLGEASIRAGIAGAPMVIITAITAICGFILTPYYSFMPIARFFSSCIRTGAGSVRHIPGYCCRSDSLVQLKILRRSFYGSIGSPEPFRFERHHN